MKKNYFLILVLLLANIFSVAAKVNEKLEAEEATITFNIDVPSQVIVKAGEEVVTDFSASKAFVKGTKIEISAVDGFGIAKISTSTQGDLTLDENGASFVVDQDMTVNVTSGAIYNVTIDVDNAANVELTTGGGGGRVLTGLKDGINTLKLNAKDSPLAVVADNGAKLVSVKKNGATVNPGGGGKLRVTLSEGANIEVRTQGAALPAVTFRVTDPSHIIVKVGDVVIPDISSPLNCAKDSHIFISPVDGYKIIKVSTSVRGEIPSGANDTYSFSVSDDMTVTVESEAVLPVLTFNIDMPERVSVTDGATSKPIDLSTGIASLAKGTPLVMKTSDAKYTITSLKVDGKDLQASGGGAITYHWEVKADATIAITTSSKDNPTIRFDVDKPENVKVYFADNKEELLDVTKAYEVVKNKQLIIEPASNDFRVASVIANGLKLIPATDGKYTVSVTLDMTIEIKTKGNSPTLTFNIDAPERIKVCKGTEPLDISNPVELPVGTEITLEAAAENFKIKSIKAGNDILAVGEDGKYHITVSTDMDITVTTAAALTLHIAKPEGGAVSVFRGEEELSDGAVVNSGDKLYFKNTADAKYVFISYQVNGKDFVDNYVVSGSQDITVSATFRTVKEGYAVVKFDIDEEAAILVTKSVTNGDGTSTRLSSDTRIVELKKGEFINLYLLSVGTYFKFCTVNGVEMTPSEDEKSYKIEIKEDLLEIKFELKHKVEACVDFTNDPTALTIGWVYFKKDGKLTDDHLLCDVGETLELVAEPLDGYEFKYFYRNYKEEDKIEGSTYTVSQADYDSSDRRVIIKGVFTKIVGITDVNSLQSYYNAETMQIITAGGGTKVYAISGQMVLESTDTIISVAALEKGMYIVKAQDREFKLIKK